MTKNQLKVLMMPDYRQDNPYQMLLAQSLRSQTVTVTFSSGYRRVFPLWREVYFSAADVLHLHWLTPYLKGEIWLVRLIYSLKLIMDLWLVRLKGVKIIWTIHNQLSHNGNYPQLELWLRKRLAGLVDEIIVHDHGAAKSTEQVWGLNFPLSVIPHGHYRDAYPSAVSQVEARAKLNLPLDGLLYLNLGMIRPYKGIEPLLQVWQENQDQFKSQNLLIVGKPLNIGYEAKISRLAQAVKGVIFEPGFIPGENIHLYFSAADLVVLPFTNILTSGSLILAMSYDKPIIAPCQDGIAETLNKANSLLYDPDDPQGLATALKASAKVDLLELSHQVKIAGDRLSWEKIAQQTAQLYSQ